MPAAPALIPGVTVETVPVGDLIEHPANPRRGNVDAIVASIRQDGWHGVVVRQKSTGHILAGNHRTRAARLAGLTELPVQTLDVDDDTALRILVKDNRLTDMGGFNVESLVAVLQDLSVVEDGLVGSGFTEADLAGYAAKLPSAKQPPGEFPEFGENIETRFQCPRCAYEWSGKQSSGVWATEGGTAGS